MIRRLPPRVQRQQLPHYNIFRKASFGYSSAANMAGARSNGAAAGCVVFATIFSPSGDYLIAANSFGHICVWNIGDCLAYDPEAPGVSSPRSAPLFWFEAHPSVVYSLEFAKSPREILISGGDEEIRGWDWKELVARGQAGGKLEHVQSAFKLQNPRVEGPGGMLGSFTETNGLSVAGTVLYSAGGDSFGHLWDLNTLTQTGCLKGHSDYLHCIRARPTSQQVVTGSEDGTVRLWDLRTHTASHVLDPTNGVVDTGNAKGSKKRLWVGCLNLDEGESWMVCGGGMQFLSLWHLDSLSVTAIMPTAGAAQTALFHGNKVISGGTDNYIYHWNSDGHMEFHVPTSSSSVFSASLNSQSIPNRVLVAAGNSGDIDVYTHFTTKAFSLRTV